MTEETIDPIDKAVGARIRIRRQSINVSQTALADALGVSFQQVQKYERGINRISASMLVRAAEKLKCSVAHLVGEEEGGIMDPALLASLAVHGAVDMLHAYAAIADGELRTSLMTVARSMAPAQGRGRGLKAA